MAMDTHRRRARDQPAALSTKKPQQRVLGVKTCCWHLSRERFFSQAVSRFLACGHTLLSAPWRHCVGAGP